MSSTGFPSTQEFAESNAAARNAFFAALSDLHDHPPRDLHANASLDTFINAGEWIRTVFVSLDPTGQGLGVLILARLAMQYEQHGDVKRMRETLALLLDLAIPHCAQLEAKARETVLTTLFNEGLSRKSVARRLDIYELVLQLCEPIDHRRSVLEKNVVMRTLVSIGSLYVGDSEPGLAQRYLRRAVVLGSDPHYHANDTSLSGEFLEAIFELAKTQSPADERIRTLSLARAIVPMSFDRGPENSFDRLSTRARGGYLALLIAEAEVRAELKQRKYARALCAKVVFLGYPVFDGLGRFGKAAILIAAFRLAFGVDDDDEPSPEQIAFKLTVELGVPVFSELPEYGQDIVLLALVNHGDCDKQLGNPDMAIAQFERAIHLGEASFSALGSQSRGIVLRALVQLGNMAISREDRQTGVGCYKRAIELGLPVFDHLTSSGRSEFLTAAYNVAAAGTDEASPDSALEFYALPSNLGLAVFSELDAVGKTVVLRSLFNSAVLLRRLGIPVGQNARRIVEMCEPYFRAFGQNEQRLILECLCLAARVTRWHSEGSRLPAVQLLNLTSVLSADTIVRSTFENWDIEAIRVALSTPDARLIDSSVDEVHRWLLSASSYSVEKPRQRRALIDLIVEISVYEAKIDGGAVNNAFAAGRRLLAAATRRRQLTTALAAALGGRCSTPISTAEFKRALSMRLFHMRTWSNKSSVALRRMISELEALNEARPVQNFIECIAAAAAENEMRSLGIRDELQNCGQVILASVLASSSAASIDDFERFLQSDEARSSVASALATAFPVHAGSPHRSVGDWFYGIEDARLRRCRLAPQLFTESGEFTQILERLGHRDSKAAYESLQAAWDSITRSASAAHSGGRAARLTETLKRYGVEQPRWRALNAIVFAQTRDAVREAVRVWARTKLHAAGPDKSPVVRELFDDVVASMAIAKRRPSLAGLLHRAVIAETDTLGVHDVDRIWTALEIARFGLAAVSPYDSLPSVSFRGGASSQHMTGEVVNRLTEVYRSSIENLANRLRSNGEARDVERPQSPRDSATLPHWDVLARELRDLGHYVRVPERAEVAERLERHERLVQLWFDSRGTLRALEVRPDGRAALRSLPNALNRAAWQDTLNLWADFKAQYRRRAESFLVSLPLALQAWESFTDRTGCAVNTLRELDDSGSDCRHVILIPCAELASLPWLALAAHVGADATSLSRTPRIQLEPSVCAWRHKARARGSQTSERADIARVIVAPGAFGEAEATIASAALASASVVANQIGGLDLSLALATPGPKHLALHGHLDLEAPTLGGIELGGAFVPINALAMMTVTGDITLSVCEAMLSETKGSARWIGPVGIGALLRARGADSVTGPLWPCVQFASLMFILIWFSERRTQRPLNALAATQTTLRSMEAEDFIQRTMAMSPAFEAEAWHFVERIRALTNSRCPFAHPAFWAAYTVFGN